MLRSPVILPQYVSEVVPGEGLFLLSEDRSDVFTGELFERLPPYLAGSHTLDEIILELRPSHSAAEIIYAIALLRDGGFLADADCSSTHAPASGETVRLLDANHRLVLDNRSSIPDLSLASLLAAETPRDKSSEVLTLLAVDDYLDEGLNDFNARAIRDGLKWALLKPTGSILWAGPVFMAAGVTPCWKCLEARLRFNRHVPRFVERHTGRAVRYPPKAMPLAEILSTSLVAMTLADLVFKDAENQNLAVLRTLDVRRGELQRHPVLRLSQCPACGDPGHPSRSISLAREPGTVAAVDGGFRSLMASTTFERLKHHVSPLTGTVSHLFRVETGDDDIHVYVAGQNFGVTDGTLALLNKTLRSRSSGKGTSDLQAKVSALCESLERYASVFQGSEEYLIGSVASLGASAIHPNDCMLFSDRQFQERDVRNVGADHFSWIPRRLQDDEQLWWTPVHSLTRDEIKYVPTAHLYFHSEELRDPIGMITCRVDSNGNAAGNSYDEALLQGLLELIERDAVALWWYSRSKLTALSLESCLSEYVSRCLNYHTAIGRELWVLDATSDLGVPTFVAVSRRVEKPEFIALGFGAHLDPRIATHRAIGEVNQLLVSVDSRMRSKDTYLDATRLWLEQATVDQESYLAPDYNAPAVRLERYPQPLKSIAQSVDHCLATLARAGLDPYALDLTRPDVDLKVVKVLCPGIRHFWSRFAPGRLYGVPVALGRVPRHLAEAELNPVPMFL